MKYYIQVYKVVKSKPVVDNLSLFPVGDSGTISCESSALQAALPGGVCQ